MKLFQMVFILLTCELLPLKSDKPVCYQYFSGNCGLYYGGKHCYWEYPVNTVQNPSNPPTTAYDGESYIGLEDINDKVKLHAAAQEGRSFCIAPEHIRKTGLKHWARLEQIQPLLDVNLDIGTHIHPLDYSKMNAQEKEFLQPFDEDGVLCFKEPNQISTAHEYRPAVFSNQPDLNCVNPYKIKVTEIKANGLRMQNWLHIKVYSDIFSAEQKTLKNCPTGKIKYLLLEVRDQGGLPVGVFTDEMPCDSPANERNNEKTGFPFDLTCKKHVGTRENRMPCMFDPVRSIMHPELFFVSYKSGTNTESDSSPGGGPSTNTGGAASTGDYFTEIHATWKFAQHTSNFVSELHFSTLIIEDEKKLQYYTGRRTKFMAEEYCKIGDLKELYKSRWPYQNCCRKIICDPTGFCSCKRSQYNNNDNNECSRWYYSERQNPPKPSYVNPEYLAGRLSDGPGSTSSDWRGYGCFTSKKGSGDRPYGYTAQYTMLKPTLKTLGAPDHFRKNYIKSSHVNCQVEISGDTYYGSGPNLKGKIPVKSKWLKNELHSAWKQDFIRGGKPDSQGEAYKKLLIKVKADPYPDIPNKYLKITKGPDFAQRATSYFGTTHTFNMYSNQYEDFPPEISSELQKYPAFADVANSERCPCPKLPTTVDPEIATRPPLELDGRRSHAMQMLIAWVILVPLSMFSARYFKETYSKVFFLQEFWWFAIHVLCSFTAFIFMMGGIYSLEIKKEYPAGVWVTNTFIHVILGSVTIGIYFLHLCLGFIRAYDLQIRLIQILLHWMFGWIEYMMAAATILITASMPQGFMPCGAMYLYYAFLGFQVLVIIGMEVQARVVDNKLKLNPKRSYLPPPVMRVFHKNAPWSPFRMYVLFSYTSICLGVYGGLHYMISLPGNEYSCMQETEVEKAEKEF